MDRNNMILRSFLLLLVLASCSSPTLLGGLRVPVVFTMDTEWGFQPVEYAQEDYLNFSRVVPGQAVTREISLKNTFNESARVIITHSGKIKEYMYVDKNNFVLGPSESVTIKVAVAFPDGPTSKLKKEEGVYEGTLFIEFHAI